MARKRVDPTNELQQAVDKYLPFILEIRKRAFFLIALFAVFAAIGFIYYEKIIPYLLHFLNLKGVNIVFTSPFQFITLAFNTAMLLGAFVVFPLLVFQIIAFLKPALDPHEHKTIISLVPLSIFLFVSGFTFGVIMMRYVVILFYEKSVKLDIGNYLDVTLLVSQILITAVMMGVAFQFPIFLTLAIKLGFIKYEFLASKRIFAYGISLIFATLLPPTDLFSLALLTLPLWSLYEITLIINKYFIKPSPII